MKSLSLQGEFIKWHCVSFLGAVYFGVAGPGGREGEIPQPFPSRQALKIPETW